MTSALYSLPPGAGHGMTTTDNHAAVALRLMCGMSDSVSVLHSALTDSVHHATALDSERRGAHRRVTRTSASRRPVRPQPPRGASVSSLSLRGLGLARERCSRSRASVQYVLHIVRLTCARTGWLEGALLRSRVCALDLVRAGTFVTGQAWLACASHARGAVLS
jgi:hypothetical protein